MSSPVNEKISGDVMTTLATTTLSKPYKDKISQILRSQVFNVKKEDMDTFPLKDILKKYKQIEAFVESKNYALNSKKSWYALLGTLAKEFGMDDIYKRYGGKEGKVSALSKEIDKDKTLSKGMVQLFVLNPRSEIDAKIRALEDYGHDVKKNFQHLAMALNLMHPPLRSDISNMKIVSEMPPENKRNGRYLLINDDGGTMLLYNRKKDKPHKLAEPYDKEVKLSSRVVNIVKESLQAYPRTFLLSKIESPDTPMGETEYHRLLASLDMSVNFFRHIYTIMFFKKHPFTQEREKLAKKMGTSLVVLQQTYAKIQNLPDEVKRDWGIPTGEVEASQEGFIPHEAHTKTSRAPAAVEQVIQARWSGNNFKDRPSHY
eukprot:jgi/Botrbrau1/19259/Bobra.0073s0009.1